MVRDFSKQALDKLVSQLDETEADFGAYLWDKVTDLGTRFSSWIGWLDIGDYVGKMDKYHEKMLDAHNTTYNQLLQIFSNVQQEDAAMKETFEDITEGAKGLSDYLQSLCDIINPNLSNFTTSQIKKSKKDMSKKLDQSLDTLGTVYDAQLEYARKEAEKNALVDFSKDVLSLVGGVAKLPVTMAKAVVTGRWGDVGSDCWTLINDMFSTGQDLAAITALYFGDAAALYGDLTGKRSYTAQQSMLDASIDYQGRNGLTAELEAAGWNDAALISKGIDHAVAIQQAISVTEGFIDGTMYDMGFDNTQKELDEKMFKNYDLDLERFKDYTEVSKEASKAKSVIGYVESFAKGAEKGSLESVGEEMIFQAFSGTGIGKTIKKDSSSVQKFEETITELQEDQKAAAQAVTEDPASLTDRMIKLQEQLRDITYQSLLGTGGLGVG